MVLETNNIAKRGWQHNTLAECKAKPTAKHSFKQFPPYNNSQNTLLSSPGKSWLLINLLYHVLGTNNHLHLSIKFDLLRLRNTHISNMFLFTCTFLGNFPMLWCHSLTLRHAKTHVFLNDNLLYFLPIAVSFLTYLIIFTPDKTLLIFWLSLTYPFHVYNQS